jgi:PAS domain S-box-containing protein
MHHALYLCDVVRGSDGRLSSLRTVEAWTRDGGRGLAPPAIDTELLEAAELALDTGAPANLERREPEAGRWLCIHILPQGGRIGLLYEDITERQEDRERLRATADGQAFLLSLSDALRTLADAEAIQLTTARVLADRLEADRVGYAEDRGDGETVTIGLHHAVGLPSLSGVYRYTDFGREIRDAFHAGRTVVCTDIANDRSLTEAVRAAHAQLGIGSMVDVPLVKAGRLVAVFFVHLARIHAWTRAEVGLIEEVAERTWAAMERARAEAAGRDSEARYRLLFDSIDEGFCVVEVIFEGDVARDYRFLEMNRAFGALTGLVDAAGHTIRELRPRHEEHWYETYGRIARTGVPERFVHEAQSLGERWFDVYAFRVGDPQARKVAMLFKDITAQRRTEQALIEADRRKDDFLAVLAHELRNPLAPVRTGLDVLKLTPGDRDVADRTHAMMERQVGHMVRLIDDLMDLSRIARGKLQLRREQTTVNDALRGAIETTAPLVDASRHGLELQIPAEPLVVDGDPVRLTQVFANLLNNAARYTTPGGSIRVEARRENAGIRVDVDDTGIGISPGLLERVFEPFTQFRAPNGTQGGLGVGLALAKSLVELHGGTIVAQSEGTGHGSRFTVRLPAADAASATPADQPAAAARTSRRVLVVDDNRDAAEALAMLLELVGHEVHLAHDGPSAVSAADIHRPDVVLLDIGLPGLDGYEVARQLRSRPALRDTLIVALSGYGQNSDRQRSLDAGCDYHMVKPADATMLEGMIARGRAAGAP